MSDSSAETNPTAKPKVGQKVAEEFWVGKVYKVDQPFTRPADMTDLCYKNLLKSGKVVDA
jgi:hypothetical protein